MYRTRPSLRLAVLPWALLACSASDAVVELSTDDPRPDAGSRADLPLPRPGADASSPVRPDAPLPGADANIPGDDVVRSSDGGGAPRPERCNGEDDDGDGMVDETCVCAPGAMQACYLGPAGTRTRGTCRDGMQRCNGAGEFGEWGPCEGSTLPETDLCGDSIDQNCNGIVDDGPACCRAGDTQACYSGPMGTQGVGICRVGTRSCVAAGTYGPCTGEVLPRTESCNGVDDDCDGTTDEDCQSCIQVTGSSTPWQMHLGEGPRCWGRTFARHGDPEEYAFARIPPEADPGWRAHVAPSISFADPSTLCGVCDCRAGGDFTYFQTTFFIPPNFMVRSLRVNIANVDDGVSVTVFNVRYPNGIVDPGAFAYLGGGSTADLASYIVPGSNRVVLTHVDDCCADRRIANASITLNGTNLRPCGG